MLKGEVIDSPKYFTSFGHLYKIEIILFKILLYFQVSWYFHCQKDELSLESYFVLLNITNSPLTIRKTKECC